MKKSISILLIVLHSFGIINSALGIESEYRLAPGDVLDVKIVGQDKLDTKQTITPDGTISLPMLGRLTASGLTLKQLDSALASGFSKYINKPQVVVYLTPRPIYVVQHDQSKNTWDVKEAKSVAEALAYTGGVTNENVGQGLVPCREIKHGDVVSVEAGAKSDWWQQNWYKIITATAVVAGVYVTLHK